MFPTWHGKAGKWRVAVDGKEGKPYDSVSLTTFSPDSRHWLMRRCRRGLGVVVDGEEGMNRFNAILKGAMLVFTDTTHLHTLALNLSGTHLSVMRLRSGTDFSGSCGCDAFGLTEIT